MAVFLVKLNLCHVCNKLSIFCTYTWYIQRLHSTSSGQRLLVFILFIIIISSDVTIIFIIAGILLSGLSWLLMLGFANIFFRSQMIFQVRSIFVCGSFHTYCTSFLPQNEFPQTFLCVENVTYSVSISCWGAPLFLNFWLISYHSQLWMCNTDSLEKIFIMICHTSQFCYQCL